MPKLYLASKSPRRREILASMGVTDIALLVNGPKTPGAFAGDVVQLAEEAPEDYVLRTAQEKALQALERIRSMQLAPAPVLAADTVVILKGEILGKPADPEEARQMLTALQGNTHQVYTGTALLIYDSEGNRSVINHAVETKVIVHRMSQEEIRAYIATGEPMDKAGAYGIQGRFAAYIDGIEGDYYNVVGLPVSYIYQELKKSGFAGEL